MSENKDIHIDKISITSTAKPDSQGLLHWDLTLKPGAKRECRIGYQVEYPSELVLETKRRRMQEASPANPSPPAHPAKSRIEDQIMDLETQF